MKIQNLKNISTGKRKEILERSYSRNSEIFPVVKKILNNIKSYGDSVILDKYQQRYDKSFRIDTSRQEVETAYSTVSKEFINALKNAQSNITKVCRYEKKTTISSVCNVTKGIRVWREWRPIEKVGLYIPGGKAIYPSSVLMTTIPALIAGCKEIIICTPPDTDGKIPSPTLVTADILGIKNIYKVGGAEAIAAMTYGTDTIPNVYKIFGAGSAFVTEAKMQVFGIVNIDMPAGPSEVLIIADDTANPKYIAADLLADGEHGFDSGCVLLTTSQRIAEMTQKEIFKQLRNISTKNRVKESLRQYGLIAIVESLSEAIDFTNEYAPEHLEIMTSNPERVLSKISNAGSIFLGPWTSKSAGDYATGANHVLPTGGMAKMFPPLSVESFGKMMQVQEVASQQALKQIKKTIETFGEIEGLPAHKNATSIRFEKGGEQK